MKNKRKYTIYPYVWGPLYDNDGSQLHPIVNSKRDAAKWVHTFERVNNISIGCTITFVGSYIQQGIKPISSKNIKWRVV